MDFQSRFLHHWRKGRTGTCRKLPPFPPDSGITGEDIRSQSSSPVLSFCSSRETASDQRTPSQELPWSVVDPWFPRFIRRSAGTLFAVAILWDTIDSIMWFCGSRFVSSSFDFWSVHALMRGRRVSLCPFYATIVSVKESRIRSICAPVFGLLRRDWEG